MMHGGLTAPGRSAVASEIETDPSSAHHRIVTVMRLVDQHSTLRLERINAYANDAITRAPILTGEPPPTQRQ